MAVAGRGRISVLVACGGAGTEKASRLPPLTPHQNRLSRHHCSLFFFQAEDGIRDGTVTGVQTCALPISGGYNLPGSVFDKEFRCAFDLLATIPTAADPNVSVKDQFFTFNNQNPFDDRTHIIDRDLHVVHGPRFGLSLWDGLALARVVLTPEAMLDGRRIEEFFAPRFFSTQFWLLWSTIFGSLPQHSATEVGRYMNRGSARCAHLSDLSHVLRTPVNQYQAFIEPLVAWLRQHGVNFLAGTFVRDIGF